MLLSMTGFGASKGQNERLNVAVEVRAVNNRYLKVNSRFPDAYAALEGEIERVVREHVVRHGHSRIRRPTGRGDVRVAAQCRCAHGVLEPSEGRVTSSHRRRTGVGHFQLPVAPRRGH